MGCVAEHSVSTLKRALRAVSRGEMWLERRLMSQILQGFLCASALPKLTQREYDVLKLIAEGYKNREIADRLFITHETVRWHIRSLNSKLGAHDRLEMAVYAQQYLQGQPGL